MKTKLAIITVVYNHYTLLNDFFFSLNQQNNTNFKLFLSDTSEKKQSIPSQSFALEILNLKNLGYAYAINQGLKKAANSGFNYFCIINDDTYFNKDFVDQALKSLIKHSPALIGGKIYYAPGYEYHKHYNNNNLGKVIWYAGGEIDWQNCLTRHIGVDQVDTDQFAKFTTTEFITGCLMLYHKKILETVGFWNEKYFLYYEDADYCQQAKLKGFPLYYDPSIIIYHKNSQSTQGSGSLLHQQYQKKNQLKFGLKYAPWKTKLHLIKNYFFS